MNYIYNHIVHLRASGAYSSACIQWADTCIGTMGIDQFLSSTAWSKARHDYFSNSIYAVDELCESISFYYPKPGQMHATTNLHNSCME